MFFWFIVNAMQAIKLFLLNGSFFSYLSINPTPTLLERCQQA